VILIAAEVTLAIGLGFLTQPLAEWFGNTGFVFGPIDPYQAAVRVSLIVLILLASLVVRESTFAFGYHITLALVVLPAQVMCLCGGLSAFSASLLLIPLGAILVVYWFDVVVASKRSRQKDSLLVGDWQPWQPRFAVLFILVSVALVPFMLRLPSADFSNLLFENVYDARSAFQSESSLLTSYTFSPLGRFVIPSLIVYGFWTKRKSIFFISVAYLIVVYLTSGALKGLLYVSALVFVLSFGRSLLKKTGIFLSILNIAVWLVVCVPGLGMMPKMLAAIRSVLFTPALLFDQYVTYFRGHWIGVGGYFRGFHVAGEVNTGDPLTRWFGSDVLGLSGVNASVGSFAQATICFGVLGMIVVSVLFACFIAFFRRLRVDARFAGLLLVFVTLFNGAFLQTLLLTHGLVEMFAILLWVIPRDRSREHLAGAIMAGGLKTG